MGFERRAVELLDEPPAMDDADPRREPVDLAQDVARHEHRHATLASEVAEQLADLDHAGRVEAVGGFIEHQEFGLVEQRPRESQPLEVAERQGPGAPVRVGLQREPLDHPTDGRAFADSRQAAGDVEVLADGQLGICGRGLHQVADAPPQVSRPRHRPAGRTARRGRPSGGSSRAASGSSSTCRRR